jgi:glycosyltransferase involved in cell wall biosynthesis
MKVLWLASWYPNQISPYEGDFIQRHARAVTAYSKVTVVYVSQAGETVNIHNTQFIEQEQDNVVEKKVFFQFKKTGLKWFDKIRYNVIYYKTYKQLITEYIKTSGRPDIVHVHVPMKAGIIALWMKRRWRIPYIVSEQSSFYNRFSPGNFHQRSFLYRHNVKKVFNQADMVTNVSAVVGDKIKKLFDLVEVKVIHNTVNTSLFNYQKHAALKFRFIHVSTLTHQKNVEGILNAVKGLSKLRQDFELVLVGPIGPPLKKMIETLDIASVVIHTGEISYPDVASQMQKASAFVLFSRHENFPCVIVEALCCGLPCIAANVGGVREAVNNDNGIIVKSENEIQLMEAMSEMMNEYHRFDKLRIAEEAQKKFSYSIIGKQFYQLYGEILKNNG